MTAAELQLVVFEVAGEEYALELATVREVAPGDALVPLAEEIAPAVGMTRASTGWVPTLGARERLGLAGGAPAIHTLVVRHPAGRDVGLQVDRVREIVTVPASAVEAPPQIFRTPGADAVRSLVRLGEDRLAMLLDVEVLLAAPEVERLADAAPAEGPGNETETLQRES